MASPQSFLDNRENLRLVMFVALEHTQGNREEFQKTATGSQMRRFERTVSQIRTYAEQLEREFDKLEYFTERPLASKLALKAYFSGEGEMTSWGN